MACMNDARTKFFLKVGNNFTSGTVERMDTTEKIRRKKCWKHKLYVEDGNVESATRLSRSFLCERVFFSKCLF